MYCSSRHVAPPGLCAIILALFFFGESCPQESQTLPQCFSPLRLETRSDSQHPYARDIGTSAPEHCTVWPQLAAHTRNPHIEPRHSAPGCQVHASMHWELSSCSDGGEIQADTVDSSAHHGIWALSASPSLSGDDEGDVDAAVSPPVLPAVTAALPQVPERGVGSPTRTTCRSTKSRSPRRDRQHGTSSHESCVGSGEEDLHVSSRFEVIQGTFVHVTGFTPAPAPPGTAWWHHPLHASCSMRRSALGVNGKQRRPILIHSLMSGLGTKICAFQVVR